MIKDLERYIDTDNIVKFLDSRDKAVYSLMQRAAEIPEVTGGEGWRGLYRHANRVSCWCCPLQDLGRLRFLYRYHPALWRRLREMDDREIERGCRKFRPDYSVAELEMWFAAEEKQQRMSLGEWKDGNK